jgi:hypothetical protein
VLKIRRGFILVLASIFWLLLPARIEAQKPSSRGERNDSQTGEQSPLSKEKIVKTESLLAAEAARQQGGLVKAMLFVDSNGKIVRCFNSFLTGTAANTLPCGFTARADRQSDRLTVINFGFKVDDRFILTTPVIGNRFQGESAQPTTAPIYFHPAAEDTVVVTTSRPEQAFMIFVF